ncbi:MAG: 2,3-dihydroxybiphenyl 1,2-dioxygenase [Gammaproteobacteria bacterium]|jgi:2,3-dihydroxybiphenyl 1,2-dioxygenase
MASVSGLGYVGCTITDYEPWHQLLRTVYGLQRRDDSPTGVHQYRLDDQHHRLALKEGTEDKLAYVGWEVDTREDLRTIAARLSENDIQVEGGERDLCAARAVMELIAFEGPDGVRTEVFFGPKQDSTPFSPRHGMSGYNTGNLGLGHVVLVAEDPDETVKWYREMLGFKLSDYVFWDGIEATFLHCNPRHHSLAFVNPVGPFNAGDLNHIMLEAKSLDDIGRGYDTALENNVPLAMTLGRHSNDLTTSFYAVTPSGWWIEYGHGGRLIDDAVWEPKMYSSPKLWGHARQLPS